MFARPHTMRTIRDSIHGDIALPPIHSSVVDTVEFQRLRYIRQNGLLHFVFPGAVHTRFAHSLGAMALARRLIRSLLHRVSAHEPAGVTYIALVFELAALLHDVGHCAFSHSIEAVTTKSGPLLSTLSDVFPKWGESELLATYLRAYPEQRGEEAITHEQLSLLLIGRIFRQPDVENACTIQGLDPGALARDVQALLNDALAPSAVFEANALSLHGGLEKDKQLSGLNSSFFVADLVTALHHLLSGSLDVDRLDYLTRDSVHCGVPYGKCDSEMLLNHLTLVNLDGRLTCAIHRKAVPALDDMLWSRYQMFVQVYNHKANVVLNALLGLALQEALLDCAIDLKPPNRPEDYICLTDDQVMSAVFTACVRSPEKKKTAYGQALVARRLPRHVSSEVIDSALTDSDIENKITKARAENPKTICGKASSFLVKPGQLFVVETNKSDQSISIEPYNIYSTLSDGAEGARTSHRELHFYEARGDDS